MVKIAIRIQIEEFVENVPTNIEEVYKNGSNWYSIQITGCEFQAVVPATPLNLSWGVRSLKQKFFQKLVTDFEAGKPLPFEIKNN